MPAPFPSSQLDHYHITAARCLWSLPASRQQQHRQQGRHFWQRQPHTLTATATARGAQAALQAPTARVYRATCPLVGWEGLEEALGQLYPPQLALHHYVVVESLAAAAQPAVAAFDFLPSDPQSPLTAALLLSGGSVPGIVRYRPLSGVPKQRCQYQGSTHLADPLAAAAAFQDTLNPRLQLLQNDCTHHADQLIGYLLSGSRGPAA